MNNTPLKFMTYDDMQKYGHDVHELCYCYDERNPEHWRKDSLYLSDETLIALQPYIDKMIDNFAYYGPQKVTIEEWENIKNLYNENCNDSKQFFDMVNSWLAKMQDSNSYFWILGY